MVNDNQLNAKGHILLSETCVTADTAVPSPANNMGIQESKMWSISSQPCILCPKWLKQRLTIKLNAKLAALLTGCFKISDFQSCSFPNGVPQYAIVLHGVDGNSVPIVQERIGLTALHRFLIYRVSQNLPFINEHCKSSRGKCFSNLLGHGTHSQTPPWGIYNLFMDLRLPRIHFLRDLACMPCFIELEFIHHIPPKVNQGVQFNFHSFPEPFFSYFYPNKGIRFSKSLLRIMFSSSSCSLCRLFLSHHLPNRHHMLGLSWQYRCSPLTRLVSKPLRQQWGVASLFFFLSFSLRRIRTYRTLSINKHG